MTDNLIPIDGIKKKYELEKNAAVVVRDAINNISQKKIITEVNKDVVDKKLSYSDAAKDIAGAGSSSSKYTTPLRTKQVIEQLAGVGYITLTILEGF